MQDSMPENYDVVILGGGLAGLSLALQLRKRIPQLKISVVEKSVFPVPAAAHKVGEATVELSTYYFSQVIGILKHLKESQLPKLGLRYFFPVSSKSRHSLEEKLEFGTKLFPPAPSFQLDRGIMENYLKETCDEQGIKVWQNTRVTDIDVGNKNTLHHVYCADIDSDKSLNLTGKWVIDASSRASIIKKKLDLLEESPHKASAAWFRIAEKIDVNDWHDSPQWREHHNEHNSRWYSTNHIMGEGYWVWFIPLASGSTSVGIVTDNNFHPLNEYNNLEKALAWLEKYEPLCAAKVIPHLDKLQDFKAVRNFSHSAKQVYSSDRWFLTGEAGVFLDPFYSPGSDYIGMSNTLITNIIEKDFNGEDVASLTRKSNRLYLGLFESTVTIYENKYQVFGKPTIMLLKYLWDTTLYWGLNTLLFAHRKFENQSELQAYYISVSDLVDLNKQIQQLFIDWGQYPQQQCVPGYIDISSGKFKFFIDMNRALIADLNKEQFDYQLEVNAEKIRTLYCDIVGHITRKTPELAGKYPVPDIGLYATSSPIEYLMKLAVGEISMDDQYKEVMTEAVREADAVM